MGFLYNASESGRQDTKLEDESQYIKYILEAFTYLLIAIGIVMILKLYFQTVLIFAKYFPYITLPLYVIGAWLYSAGLLYFAWDIMEDSSNLLMTYPQVAMFQQGCVVGAVFLMIAPFTLLMPRLRFGRSSADADGCCKTICFPTFVWVVFLFIVLLCAFAGYCLLTTLLSFYNVAFFKAVGLEGIFVLLLLFYLFALFQIIAQRKIIVSGENILGKLREPFKCLHTRPYLFIYIFVLIFFSLGALGLDGLYAFKSYEQYTAKINGAATAVSDTAIQCMAIIGAFSGFSALYVLIGLTIALVISCSRSTKSDPPQTTGVAYVAPRQQQPEMGGEFNDSQRSRYVDSPNNRPLSTQTTTLEKQKAEYNEYNDATMDSMRNHNNNIMYHDGSTRSATIEMKPVPNHTAPKTVAITMQHSDGSRSNLGAIRAFPHTTLADARILTRSLPNAPNSYVFITRNREVNEAQEAEFNIYGLEELILAVETVC